MLFCEQCGENEATVHITRIEKDRATASHLCETCARALGFVVKLPHGQAPSVAPGAGDDRECSRCGLKFSEFKATGLLGCASCYVEFEEEIEKGLADGHAAYEGKGRRHAVDRDQVADVKKLAAELAEAVRCEKFELAAELRDKIRKHSGTAPSPK